MFRFLVILAAVSAAFSLERKVGQRLRFRSVPITTCHDVYPTEELLSPVLNRRETGKWELDSQVQGSVWNLNPEYFSDTKTTKSGLIRCFSRSVQERFLLHNWTWSCWKRNHFQIGQFSFLLIKTFWIQSLDQPSWRVSIVFPGLFHCSDPSDGFKNSHIVEKLPRMSERYLFYKI